MDSSVLLLIWSVSTWSSQQSFVVSRTIMSYHELLDSSREGQSCFPALSQARSKILKYE